MKTIHKKHITYYTLLFVLLSISMVFVLQNTSDKRIQMTALVLTGFIYTIAGILHHIAEHNLTTKIMVEYVLMGSLGILILLLFFRGVGL